MANLQDTDVTPAPAAFGRIAPPRFAALALLMLGGCSVGHYPSLQRWPAPHPVAQPAGQMQAPPAPTPVQPHIAAGCDDEAAVKDADGAAPGTPLWSKGNVALAGLQQIRTRLAQVMAPAEEAYTADRIEHAQDDARDGPGARAEGAKLAACQAHVVELSTQQDAVIDRLHARLAD
jgi:hypothetical protein